MSTNNHNGSPERNWPEDFSHENGNYTNTCCCCKLYFVGHKRRPVCRVCGTPKSTKAEMADLRQQLAASEQARAEAERSVEVFQAQAKDNFAAKIESECRLMRRIDALKDGEQARAVAVALTEGVRLIEAERQRQINCEGWSLGHDDHDEGELAKAAACYAIDSNFSWPWDFKYWKPGGGRIRQLTKAGALIAAEIERLLRTAPASEQPERREGGAHE